MNHQNPLQYGPDVERILDLIIEGRVERSGPGCTDDDANRSDSWNNATILSMT